MSEQPMANAWHKTAAGANIHLQVRPGADAFLLRAMPCIILRRDAAFIVRKVYTSPT